MTECPFCKPDPAAIWKESEFALAIWDAFPVSKGHLLVVPKRHVASFFDLKLEEQKAVWQFVSECRADLFDEHEADGFNIGLNDGKAAGQTVAHGHIHLIPRWIGDVADPRGGIRWVLPDKAKYWSDA